MIILLKDGAQIRGDLIIFAALRFDLVPIPATLEADIIVDDDLQKKIAEGETISIASGETFRIIKATSLSQRNAQGGRERRAVRITALLDNVHQAAFIQKRAIVKNKTTLSAIYRATGASIKAIDADFSIDRFCCFAGDAPSFHIARALQEEGGVVAWKSGKLKFFRLGDLFKQKPVLMLAENASDNIQSGFLERHDAPNFYSLNDAGGIIAGKQDKARATQYIPFQNAQKLKNMTRYLMRKKIIKINFNSQIVAGDLIDFIGGQKLVVITVAHVFFSGTDDGGAQNSYSKLWLGSLEA